MMRAGLALRARAPLSRSIFSSSASCSVNGDCSSFCSRGVCVEARELQEQLVHVLADRFGRR